MKMLTLSLVIPPLLFTCSMARDVFDFTGEVFSDLSVVIPRRGKECFYQPIDDNVESVYVQYTALREDIFDELQFIVKDPTGKLVKQSSGEENNFDLDFTNASEHHQRGTYSICFLNNHLFRDVIVYLELEIWNEDSFLQDVAEDAEEALDSVGESLKKVAENVKTMGLHSNKLSQRYRRDSFELNYSNAYVNNFGIVTCLIIICAGLFQVYFIKNLFNTSHVHGIHSPT
ncbi:uncharacterized protein LOC118423754 [Branchiostoma floridae]|uniref:Uncharacterized protein LOC118423754 n=1 Tax=Branchiostoma floridae TaxID=7739 RepID=A0A9J7LT93_BRAFL|nr:uncharacterized protein LOC118423754 [Branchiostoma floridae]